mmetsp:Transcript_10265/g.30489  ORF Transcript_10265/g.30489 Transcript_10265/m.30489 type:complete len:340 (-) Transcript_10265:1030-2049(-)
MRKDELPSCTGPLLFALRCVNLWEIVWVAFWTMCWMMGVTELRTSPQTGPQKPQSHVCVISLFALTSVAHQNRPIGLQSVVHWWYVLPWTLNGNLHGLLLTVLHSAPMKARPSTLASVISRSSVWSSQDGGPVIQWPGKMFTCDLSRRSLQSPVPRWYPQFLQPGVCRHPTWHSIGFITVVCLAISEPYSHSWCFWHAWMYPVTPPSTDNFNPWKPVFCSTFHSAPSMGSNCARICPSASVTLGLSKNNTSEVFPFPKYGVRALLFGNWNTCIEIRPLCSRTLMKLSMTHLVAETEIIGKFGHLNPSLAFSGGSAGFVYGLMFLVVSTFTNSTPTMTSM